MDEINHSLHSTSGLIISIAVVPLYSDYLCVSVCVCVCVSMFLSVCCYYCFFSDCRIYLFSSLAARVFNGPVVHPKNFKRLCMGGTKYPHVQYQIFSTIGCGLLQEFHSLVQQFKLNPMSCSA